jgi:hypothetical protein
MAVLAKQRVSLVILGMLTQTKVGIYSMLERFPIQEGWRPTILIMAFETIRRKHSKMNLWFCMAGCTFNWRAAECLT